MHEFAVVDTYMVDFSMNQIFKIGSYSGYFSSNFDTSNNIYIYSHVT